jgi:alkylation response protein AidB-like acyl-CoA dehydrogenase
MGLALSAAHRELEQVAMSVLSDLDARAAGRAMLDAEHDQLPVIWHDLAALGWFGIHLPEACGGSGFGLEELVVVIEAMGRAVAPGPFVPTATASGILARCAGKELGSRYLPALAQGALTAAVGFADTLACEESRLSGSVTAVIGGGPAQLFVLIVGEDVAVVDASAAGLQVLTMNSVDRSRRTVALQLDGVGAEILEGAGSFARAVMRTTYAAEAAGGAAECCRMATDYAKVRTQFGQPIGSFQAVKHHCANMLVSSELAVAAAWDAARAANGPAEEFVLAAATAATLATRAYLDNSHLCIQVHGGVGFTWEHDAHLLMRRALTIAAVFGGDDPERDVVRAARGGVARSPSFTLPAEAEEIRAEVREAAEQIGRLPKEERLEPLLSAGWVMPHWPKPWGREATATEQLVIDQELDAAAIRRPQYGITAWVLLTLIQFGTAEQVERYVPPGLRKRESWCQLFSEPEAGSDAANVRTSATRTQGGWLLNGQKVWTSGAGEATFGLATVRTDPAAAKHDGITTVIVEMAAPGVEVRPLRQMNGASHFNEVFLDDVFVRDADVVGELNAGWSVARATLGYERVSIGGGATGGFDGAIDLVALLDEHGRDGSDLEDEVGVHLATRQALKLLNVRSAARAVSGAGPGPEGNITKLVLAELGHRTAALGLKVLGPAAAFLEGPGRATAKVTLGTRGMSIAGGTSEVTRNQIGERLLGLPRDRQLT